ncbi:hypothetical protein PMLGA01_080025900 [Plasmodium malariae]|uniref:RSE1/DDB1/CPSF1 first beta-propeller domain-containing protein n=1 Tax=Plasmodium malariae TaxID=5858 RepID=A0A1C3KYL9_PLAMA|nr:hypothetical protein PMLGA01_080025900 [Plasmodium malariae]
MSIYHFYNNAIPSTSIRTAICTNIKGNKKKYLLYACNNYLNVCCVDKDGFTDDFSKHVVFSEVLELREYLPEKLTDRDKKENIKSYVFLLTRKYNLLLLEFDIKLNDFVTLSQINLHELNGMHIEEDITFLLDERQRTVLFYGYKNILKYIYLDYDDYFNLSRLYTLRLDEGLIIDITFVNSYSDGYHDVGINEGDDDEEDDYLDYSDHGNKDESINGCNYERNDDPNNHFSNDHLNNDHLNNDHVSNARSKEEADRGRGRRNSHKGRNNTDEYYSKHSSKE